MDKKWIWLIGGVLVVVVLYLLLGQGSDEVVAQVGGEETAVVFIGDLADTATASGQVEPQRRGRLQFTSGGTVSAVYVSVGDVVAANDPLVQLDTADLARAVADAELSLRQQQASLAALVATPTAVDLAAAEAAVANAQAQLADLLAGPSAAEIEAAEATLRAAAADIAAAAARLSEAQAGGSAAEIRAAQYQLELAQKGQVEAEEAHVRVLVSESISEDRRAEMEPGLAAAAVQANAELAAAQTALEELLNGDGDTIVAQQASLAAAQAGRDVAQAQLDRLLAGATAAEIAAAEASLADAEASLAVLLRGATVAQVATAEAQVRQAEIQLAQAALALEKGTLLAPFPGVVTAVSVSPGEQAAGVVVELVDMDSLEVVLTVDEVDVGQVVVGQTAVVTLEAWPNTEIASEVTAIEPSAIVDGSGIVSFAVHLGLAQAELPLRVGMTANASLVTAQREGVLLLPNAALRVDREAGTYSVHKVERDEEGEVRLTAVAVTVGLSDTQHTQITSGLNEGDEVALGVLSVSEDDSDGIGDGPPGQELQR